MTKKRDLKTKFRHFSNASHKRNESPAAKSSPDESNVTARLIKLRVEQTRAERNRQQRNNGQQAIDLAQSQSQWHDLGQVVARPKPELRRRTAGPPPPQSWIAKDKELTERFQNQYIRQRKKHGLQPWQQAVPPLWELCAHIICKQINVWYSSSDRQACMQQITRLPISTKQILLKAFSAENSETTLTDKLLPMFGGEEYRELCLEGAAISMECLVRTFWNIKSHQTVTLSVTDDWEEVAEQGIADTFGANGEYLYDPEQHSECTWHLRPLLHMAANQRSPAAIDLAKQYILYTPLAAKLTTLNLSFIQPPLPAISLAYLITQTLPDLRILSVAGTFPGKHDGPHALSILSRSLRKLIAWDIGYHPWLETSMLCDDTSPSPMIHWNRDLPNLQELSLECCGASQDERVGEQVKEWLRDHYGNRKINIVHASG